MLKTDSTKKDLEKKNVSKICLEKGPPQICIMFPKIVHANNGDDQSSPKNVKKKMSKKIGEKKC